MFSVLLLFICFLNSDQVNMIWYTTMDSTILNNYKLDFLPPKNNTQLKHEHITKRSVLAKISVRKM